MDEDSSSAAAPLWVWQPDRDNRFVRIVDPAFDDQGEEISLFDGANLPQGKHLNFTVEKAGREVPDFVYDAGLMLLVSPRAWETIRQFSVPGVKPYPVTLRDRKGRELAPLVWLNVTTSQELLDLERSAYKKSRVAGLFKEISRFHVRPALDLGEDLFACEETSTRIFSASLVSALREAQLTGAELTLLEGSRWPHVS